MGTNTTNFRIFANFKDGCHELPIRGLNLTLDLTRFCIVRLKKAVLNFRNNNYAKCQPISKILSVLETQRNF